MLREGRRISFWNDSWCKGQPLEGRLREIYNARDKNVLVGGSMGGRGEQWCLGDSI